MGFAYKSLISILGLITAITGAFMIPPFICARMAGDTEAAIIFSVTSVCSVIGGLLIFRFMPRSSTPLRTRDAYLIVFLAWIVCGIIGAIPYYLSGVITDIPDAMFESIAGFSTTGASVLGETHYTHPFLLWKALTHWLGAMGILIFVITILPAMGAGGQRIVAAESPGAGLSMTAPRSKDLAKLLYLIYGGLTLVKFLMLWLGSDMSAFGAFINSLGSISTAGLTFHPDGIAYYDSVFVEMTVTIFTIFASVNFLLFIYLIRRNFEYIRRNVEVKVFLIVIAISTILITTDLCATSTYTSFTEALRASFFQVCSFMTTSGLVYDDYTLWPTFCRMILFSMLFIGGCVASTSGSIKMLRVIVMVKLIKRGFFMRLHPRSVKSVKIGDSVLNPALVTSVTSFIVLYFATFIIGSAVLATQGLDLETTIGATASLMSTTGSSFGMIGPSGNYAMFSGPLKLFMCLLMMIGRLELYTVFLMFMPSFWNPTRARTK